MNHESIRRAFLHLWMNLSSTWWWHQVGSVRGEPMTAASRKTMKNDFQLSTPPPPRRHSAAVRAIKVIQTWQSEISHFFNCWIVFPSLFFSFRNLEIESIKIWCFVIRVENSRPSIVYPSRDWERSLPDPIINPIPMATCWDFYKLIRLEICNYLSSLSIVSKKAASGCCCSSSRVYKCVKIISFFERSNKKSEPWPRMMIMTIIKKKCRRKSKLSNLLLIFLPDSFPIHIIKQILIGTNCENLTFFAKSW